MLRRAAAPLVLAAGCAAVAAPAAAQTATTGTPQALFTHLLSADDHTAADIRAALRARRVFVDEDVTFGDLTGDGRQDAVVRVDSGGAGGTIAVYVFSTDGASKLRAVYRSQRLYRALAEIDGATLVLTTPRYGATDEVCCPADALQRSLTWSAKAQRMVLRGTQVVPV